MNYKKYERIINNVSKCAPLECGVQTLVFMLLEEVIEENNKGNKVLVADLRDNESIFGGVGGVPDLCIVNDNFKYISVSENDGEMEGHKVNRLGCVEVKYINEDVSNHIEQVAGHVVEYKKVIFTDGIKWYYYCATNEQIGRLKKILEEKIEKYEAAKQQLEYYKAELRKLCNEIINGRYLTEKNLEKIQEEVKVENKPICEKALAALKEKNNNQIDKVCLEHLMQEICKNEDSWYIQISNELSKTDKIEIIKSEYNQLKQNLANINW